MIVAHSERDELERCLGSIRDHAGMPVQVVLIDNASTDDSVSAGCGRTSREIEIVGLEENIGVAARRYGLERARAPLTMFLDSDAALTAEPWPTMVAALEQQS